MVIFKCSLTQYSLEILFMDFSKISLDTTQVSGTNFPEEQLKQWSGCNKYKKAKKIITI